MRVEVPSGEPEGVSACPDTHTDRHTPTQTPPPPRWAAATSTTHTPLLGEADPRARSQARPRRLSQYGTTSQKPRGSQQPPPHRARAAGHQTPEARHPPRLPPAAPSCTLPVPQPDTGHRPPRRLQARGQAEEGAAHRLAPQQPRHGTPGRAARLALEAQQAGEERTEGRHGGAESEPPWPAPAPPARHPPTRGFRADSTENCVSVEGLLCLVKFGFSFKNPTVHI